MVVSLTDLKGGNVNQPLPVDLFDVKETQKLKSELDVRLRIFMSQLQSGPSSWGMAAASLGGKKQLSPLGNPPPQMTELARQKTSKSKSVTGTIC